ncbi:MAG: coproporphyrinogen III oxidase [Chloroflexi bacterium]|nr:coproporphyrinogen III oxidase [Chloroflexota bacterium]
MDSGIKIDPKIFYNNKTLGIYVHIPFCQSKCFYCDFNTYANIDDQIDDYINSLIVEINIWSNILKASSIKSIFFGGGTPSYIHSKYIEKILTSLSKHFIINKNIEITLETNPNDVMKQKFNDLLKIGINRISMGVQSFDNYQLKMLGRRHDSKEAENSYNILKEIGYNNLSIDLMYGLPYQSIKSWEKTLEKSTHLDPNHISLYSLQVEKGTPLKNKIMSGEYEAPNDDNAADMYEIAEKTLFENKFSQYEISNWSKKKYECIHNKIYWENNYYLGLGAGAHSHINNIRFSNIRSPKLYTSNLNKKTSIKSNSNQLDFIENLEKLSYSEQISDTLMMGMRLNEGINLTVFEKKFGKSMTNLFKNQINKLSKLNLINVSETHIKLSKKGRLLGNEVFKEFII